MPAANSVHIDGPRRIMIVLTEATAASCPPTIEVDGFEVPVFSDRRNVRETDFTDIWLEWYRNDKVHRLEHDCVMANNELTSFICVENASSIALAVTAELYSALYLGLGVSASVDNPSYNWGEALHGGWSLFPNDTLGDGSRGMLDHWSTDPEF